MLDNCDSFDFYWVFKRCFSKCDFNFGGLVKIKVFFKKVYDVIISAHKVANKTYHVTYIYLYIWCDYLTKV